MDRDAQKSNGVFFDDISLQVISEAAVITVVPSSNGVLLRLVAVGLISPGTVPGLILYLPFCQ